MSYIAVPNLVLPAETAVDVESPSGLGTQVAELTTTVPTPSASDAERAAWLWRKAALLDAIANSGLPGCEVAEEHAADARRAAVWLIADLAVV
ncbi:hypothetical protein [Actinoalloteichus sp. GBA129-24]|uniref:hypothetical protein n=1 Tax=Actinoalloteichus sp. GBA129-24 TaxID=1612551 RepID=UPI0009508138|nr:hypothetical protein [Actinoalloteichus sp. GBA129-24]APU20132.1 hypothetical protein UA75_10595 [Actinoalloteichus sp. GBA129-24]